MTRILPSAGSLAIGGFIVCHGRSAGFLLLFWCCLPGQCGNPNFCRIILLQNPFDLVWTGGVETIASVRGGGNKKMAD